MGGFKPQQFNDSSPSAKLGSLGERVAVAAYLKRGFAIVGTNMVSTTGKRWGELDLIVKDKDTIVFVEVKTRSRPDSRFGVAQESVSVYKTRRLLKTVKLFLARHPEYRHFRPQIDICLVIPGNLDNSRFSVTILANAVRDDSR